MTMARLQQDFVYKESDTASGQINSFCKTMYYQDGFSVSDVDYIENSGGH